jgi:hypothetical protein
MFIDEIIYVYLQLHKKKAKAAFPFFFRKSGDSPTVERKMKAEVQEPEEHKEAAPKAAAAAVEASKAAAAAAESPKAAAAGTVSVISGGSVVRFGSIAEALENAKPSSKIEITGAHAGQHLIIPSQLKGFSLSLSLSLMDSLHRCAQEEHLFCVRIFENGQKIIGQS